MSDNNLYTQFDNVFFEKTRLSMITILYREGTVSFNRLKKLIDGSDGAIYTHLKKLEEALYIKQKKEFVGNKPQTTYSLTAAGKKIFIQYISFLENIIHEKPDK